MIKPGALVMAAAMTAVSAGTYFGLGLLPAGALPPPIGRVQPPPPPKPGTAPSAAPQEQAAAPVAATPAPEPAPAEQPVTEQDLAEEPPPPAPTEQASAQPAPTAPEPEPAPQPAKPAPAPYQQPPALVDEPPASKPAPAPKKKPPAEVVREDSSASGTQVAKAESADAPKSRRKAPPEADVIKPWWPDSSKLPANQLKLQYAGQVQGERAIALLFSAPLNLDSLRQHAQVKTEGGQAVTGGWELGKNPRLAVFRGVDSGRYTVILAPQIADAKGFMLGQKLSGAVYIQPPQ